MISRKQRIVYALATGLSSVIGIIIFGNAAQSIKVLPAALFSVMGGLLLGGVLTGGFLGVRYFRKRHTTRFVVCSTILFPVTLSVLYIVGVFSFIPYYIANLIILIRTKNCDDPLKVNAIAASTSSIMGIVIASLCAGAAVLGIIFASINKGLIADDIFKKTGYKAGSPDNAIIQAYYYNKDLNIGDLTKEYSYLPLTRFYLYWHRQMAILNPRSCFQVYPAAIPSPIRKQGNVSPH